VIQLRCPIQTLERVDDMVQAEIPCPMRCPDLHVAVAKFMLHAPKLEPLRPCTSLSQNGILQYRRRGKFVAIGRGRIFTDTCVYPYNSHLLQMFNGHVSVVIAMHGNRVKLARSFYRATTSRPAVPVSIDINTPSRSYVTTVGHPLATLHVHPQGLAQVQFNNCIVQVRVGCDLDRLMTLGSLGPVQLWNVQARSPIVDCNLKPITSFIFIKYMSTMSTPLGPAD
jgi:hypothetical protein